MFYYYKNLEAVCWNSHYVEIMKSTETVEALIEPSGTTFFMKYQHFYLGKNVKLIPKSVTLKRQ